MFRNFHALFSHQTIPELCQSLFSFIFRLQDVACPLFIQISYPCWRLSNRFNQFCHLSFLCCLINFWSHVSLVKSFSIRNWRTTWTSTIFSISRGHIDWWDVNFVKIRVIIGCFIFLLLWVLGKRLLKLNLLRFIFKH